MIQIIRSRATPEQMREMLEVLGIYTKLAIDVQRGILAGRGELHADCEQVLLEDGSEQANVWGADWYPFQQRVGYESLINLRPGVGNRSMEIQDPLIREQIDRIRPHCSKSFGRCAMAVNLDILKTQYLQDDTSTQVGRLAANLAQIKVLAQAGTEGQLAQDLIRESQFFIEWSVPCLNLETRLELATELVELQRQLSRWKLHWSGLWASSNDRLQIAKHAQAWSDRLLNLSGLLAS